MNKPHYGLRTKIAAGILLPLTAVLSVLAYVRHARYQDLLLANLQSAAANAGEIIEGSLQHAMLTNDFSTLEQIVYNIGQQPGVRDLFLWSKQGHVLIATDRALLDDTLLLEDASCQVCHRYKAASRNENVILDLDDGERVFRNVNVVENGPQCQACHDPAQTALGVLISDFDMADIDRALASDRRSSLLWSAGSILLTLLTVSFLVSRTVIRRLEQFVQVVKRVDQGDLHARVTSEDLDEVGDLGRSLNHMADGLLEKQRLEEDLKEQAEQLRALAEKLSTLNTVADTINQSLNLNEILHSALGKVLELMQLRAGWIVLQNGQDDRNHLAATWGLPEAIARAHVQCAWARSVCSQVLETGQPRVHPSTPDSECPTAQYFGQQGLTFRLCVPLTAKDHVLGVMSLVGDVSSESRALTQDLIEMLGAIGRQIGIAVENARLYEELRRQELLRRMLLERMMAVQEKERKRIALELHDQTGQPLTSLIFTLGVLSKAESLSEVRTYANELRDTAAQIMRQVHDLALELRPSVLDDLGLLAALRFHGKEFQDRFHVPVDLQVVGMNGSRLPPEVETALYRIVQEALTNVARHAQASNVSVLIENRGTLVTLIVEDDGKGFDVSDVVDLGALKERLGLYGMRERASLLGGTLTIESTPGTGTTLFVQIPLLKNEENYGQDPLADR